MNRVKQAQTYLTHFPVRSYLEADILSKESTWGIMEYLRKAGAKGASAEEISMSLSLPPSIVYSTLKELRRLEFIFTYPRNKMPKKERKRRYVCERGTSGKYGIDRQFLDALTLEGELGMIKEELKDPLLRVFGRLYDDFVSNRRLSRFLPSRGEENACPRCARSHEAMEFFYAAILSVIDTFVADSSEFLEFLAKRGYALK